MTFEKFVQLSTTCAERMHFRKQRRLITCFLFFLSFFRLSFCSTSPCRVVQRSESNALPSTENVTQSPQRRRRMTRQNNKTTKRYRDVSGSRPARTGVSVARKFSFFVFWKKYGGPETLAKKRICGEKGSRFSGFLRCTRRNAVAVSFLRCLFS